jgi:hypothetical protein
MKRVAISDPAELVDWRQAFLLLSLDGHAPLWAEIGVPPPLASQPRATVEMFRVFWEAHGPLRGVALGGEDVRRIGESLVEQLLSAVAARFGEATAAELQCWMRRHYVDRSLRKDYFVWSLLLSRRAPSPKNDETRVAATASLSPRDEAIIAEMPELYQLVRERLPEVLASQRAFAALSSEMDPSSLLAWGRGEAAAVGLPPASVRWPKELVP